MNNLKERQDWAIKYYDRFSHVYDMFSPKFYYQKARRYAIIQLQLKEDSIVLNLPCGTGQNFQLLQRGLNNTGKVIAIDLSQGMLDKAKGKVKKHQWSNIALYLEDAQNIDQNWMDKNHKENIELDAIFCDLGLSGFPNWKTIVDNLLKLLKPGGRIVIMDWYIPRPTLRGTIIKWIGRGEVDRPVWQYLESQVSHFELNNSFKGGDLFVAVGIKE